MEQFVKDGILTFSDIPDDYIRNIYFEYDLGYQKDIARTAVTLYLSEYKTTAYPSRDVLLAATQAAVYYHRSWGVFLTKEQHNKLQAMPEELRTLVEDAIAPQLALQNDTFLRVTLILGNDGMPVFDMADGIQLPKMVTERYDKFRPSTPLPDKLIVEQQQVVVVEKNFGYIWYAFGAAIIGLLTMGIMK